ncbi:MAG: YegS/Rv2252/BmrU family lipid kinase [Clostridiales bacterium]|nr:YegS/Rv2252/BmrU family lipid kinase [Clostridiales bacterium]
MGKKLMIILNPAAGKRRAQRYMFDILELFSTADYQCTVHITKGPGDGTTAVKKNTDQYDMIIAIGGDGTLNEVVTGLLDSKKNTPIGYIPAGSTNDFATTLGLSKDLIIATKDIIEGSKIKLDVGSFNNKYFTYVASFGAFTGASYSTPQIAKNLLGHAAYVLSGIKDLASISPIRMRVETSSNTFEGDYLFGAVSNSTSIGKIMTFDSDVVDLSDGLFEVTLIKSPQNAMDLGKIITSIQNVDFDPDCFDTCITSEATFYSDTNIPWTLDGEYFKGDSILKVKNLHNAITLILNRRKSDSV